VLDVGPFAVSSHVESSLGRGPRWIAMIEAPGMIILDILA
jgi:hypothetical protein